MDEEIKKFTERFISILNKDKNGRYKSYEHCRQCYLENKDDETKYDLITLNLYAYLASWGMLRNSFLMQKDYLFNLPIVKILCKDKYKQLIKFNPFSENCIEDIALIMALRDEIRNYYLSQKYIQEGTNSEIQISNVTDTLITKIILGTIGCVPAYDQYFVKALRKDGINGVFNEKSMIELVSFARANREVIEEECDRLGDLYTPMKMIDMYYWEKGIAK